MKKIWLVIIALVIFAALCADNVAIARRTNQNTTSNRYEVIAWEEDFEDGATGWVSSDATIPPNNWHVYNQGGTQGNVWWMGDTALASGGNIGGYYDHQYLVLDTPSRPITAGNSNLSFKARWNIEAPGGEPAPYNGWDAANVRISTNDGQTWTPITGSPAYTFTSSYAFGFQHGEGPNIPGWGGVQTTWVNCTFNLATYVGQNVKIRFAFASDPAYATQDNPAMFGIMIDDISFGGYTNNGVNDGQMTWASLVPVGGNIWSIAQVADAPSPVHVMRNQNAQGTYNINMLNYLESPPIQLPTSGDIRADFMIKGSFDDPNTFPNVDYFGWEISINNGVSWFYMSNPYGSPTGTNYVYSDAPNLWSSMTESYALDGFISDYAGQTVKFRWMFRSDGDTPIGTGIAIDDVRVYNDIFIAPPEQLAAVVNGNTVILTWEAPGTGGGGDEGWIHYDSGSNYTSIGTNAAADFDVAAKWDAMGDYGIAPYVGMNITKIKIWPNQAACQYSARIWTGTTNTLAYDQPLTGLTQNSWNEIILTTPFTIPPATQIMAGYRCNTTTGYPAGCDAGPQINGYGNMIRFQGSWTTLTALAPTLTYNWNIQVYVQDATGREYVLGHVTENEQSATGFLADSGVYQSTQSRDVTAYRIYRNGVMIDQVAGTVLTYTDMNVPGGIQTYHVTAVYGSNESLPSNSVIAFIVPTGQVEMHHDDGGAEVGLTLGPLRQMAVRYQYGSQVKVRYAKVFVHTLNTASMIIRLYSADGTGGLPGTQLAQLQYPAVNIVEGWNYIPLPNEPAFQVTNGNFYLGILETANASAIGLDTNNTGNSYRKMSAAAAWEVIPNGELLIRAIVEPYVSNEEVITPGMVLSINNYPNPFNPVTNIAYSIPAPGHAVIQIYNIKGQVVRTLLNGNVAAGNHSMVFNGLDDNGNSIASGIYFYRISHNDQSITKKMILMK